MPSTHSRLISIRIKVFIRCRMVLVIFCFLQLYADLVNCVFDIWVCVFMLAWDHAKRTFKYFQQPFDGILQWHIVSVEFYIDLKVVENFIISLTCLVMEVLQCVWPRPRRVFFDVLTSMRYVNPRKATLRIQGCFQFMNCLAEITVLASFVI